MDRKEEFVGAKVKTIQGDEKSVTKVNYFKGNDSSKWKSNISTYNVVNLGEIYKGIELRLKAYGNNVEKLFCVKPDANPDQIKIRLSGIQPPESPLEKGARGLWINDEGQLEAETELGPVKFTKPIAYQEINGKRVDVGVEYRVESSEAENKSSKHKTCNSKLMSTHPKSTIQNLSSTSIGDPKSKIANRKLEYGFKVASYDKTKDLIIDPLLASTYLGGSKDDIGYSLALDTSGNVYVTGRTSSTDFPTTSGAYDTSQNGSYDVFVSKLNGDLTTLLASAYLGGDSYDTASSLALDVSGNIYITGGTKSSDFPTTTDAYDVSYNGGNGDYFVSKLNGDLTNLISSTYLGGSSDEFYSTYAYAHSFILIDTDENIYVTGNTSSSDFPITTQAYDTSYNGCDAFVAKLNGNLTSLLASTFLGGSSVDGGYSIAKDSDENIFVTGWTFSEDFPTTLSAYDTFYNGGEFDVFVSKLNKDLTTLIASTYLGGSQYNNYATSDYVYSIALDSNGNIILAGYTGSSDFPTTSGAYDTTYGDTFNGNAFISKLNEDLTNLLASTFLGGTDEDEITSITVDPKGDIYVTGSTKSSDFPTTTDAYDTSYGGGGRNSFVSKLNSELTSLSASTYLGGSECYSISIDKNTNIYLAGLTTSSNFPTTISAYDTSFNGNVDAFVSKLNSNLSAPRDTTIPTGSISINDGVSYTNFTTTTLSLSASDSTGVAGYYLSTNSTKPSSGDTSWTSISSTTSYSADVSFNLDSGDGSKTVYVWYKDEAENVSDTASDSLTLDTTVPTVTISSPTSDETNTTTNSTISLDGSASDSTSGINSVKWSNSNGESGMASGTTNWSISSINLSSGDNTITVIATDNAGNTGKDTVTVTYMGQTSTPTPSPKVTPTSSVCEPESVELSHSKLILKRRAKSEVAIAVLGEDSCPVENETIYVEINSSGKRRVSVTPSSQVTDENGDAVFTITAKNKVGNARVTFKAGSLEKSMIVKVMK